jgi:hypothetical protein
MASPSFALRKSKPIAICFPLPGDALQTPRAAQSGRCAFAEELVYVAGDDVRFEVDAVAGLL